MKQKGLKKKVKEINKWNNGQILDKRKEKTG
jgi:hypothetical protein